VNRGKLLLVGLAVLVLPTVPAWAALIERTDTVAVVNAASATAQCPAGKTPVLGGFTTDRTNPTDNPPAPFKLQRVGADDWRASARNWQGTPGATLTSIAYCRAMPSLSVHKQTTRLGVNEQGSVTARCPEGQRVGFGGFAGVYELGGAQMFIDRLTRPTGRSWRAAAINLGDAPGDLSAIAYCGDVPPTQANKRTVSVGPSGQRSVTARCPQQQPAAFGGFESQTTAHTAFLLIDGLERTGSGWTASAQGGGGLAPGDLTAIAYCPA
jgi:hypothetical protein